MAWDDSGVWDDAGFWGDAAPPPVDPIGMEEDFRALLLSDSGVSALAGSRLAFGETAQGGPYPRVVMWTISDAPGHTMQGPDRLYQGRVQADCYALTYGEAKQLSRAVRTVLDGYRGGGFRGVFHDGTRDSREGGTNEAERPYRVSLDFTTNWSATT